jgi:CHAT domain-containing protein
MARALLCVLLLAGLARGAAPPGRMAAEQLAMFRHANAAYLRAVADWKAGKHDKAITCMEKALDITQRLDGRNSRPYLYVSLSLANWLEWRGRWKEAAGHRERAWRIQSLLWGERHWKAVDARWQARTTRLRAGLTEEQQKDWDRADALYREASETWRRGQPAITMPLERKVLALRRSLMGEKHPYVAVCLLNLALMHRTMGDHKAAVPLCRQALAIKKECLGEDHPEYAYALRSLAMLYKDMGDHKAALPLCKQALQITRRSLGEQHASYAACLRGLASLYDEMGDQRSALHLFVQAVETTRAAQGERHIDYAEALNNLGRLYKSMGDHKKALSCSRQALEICKVVVGEKHPYYATCLGSLADRYHDRKDYKAALPLYRQALEITKEAVGENNPAYPSGLNGLALLYLEMGDHKAAMLPMKQALDITRKARGEKHPKYALYLHNLGGLYHATGDYKAALPLYQQALAVYKEALGEKHPDYAHSLYTLASMSLDLGDHVAALPLAEEATARTLSHLRATAAVQSDRQQFLAAEHLRGPLDVRLSLMDVGSYGHVLAWKGAVLLRQRQRRLFSALSAGPKTRGLALELQAVTRQIVALSSSSGLVRAQLEKLTEEQERLQAGLSRLSAEASAAFEAEALTPRALSSLLPEGVVLVDYFVYERGGIAYRDGLRNRQLHLMAFVSRRGKPAARIDLGPADRAAVTMYQWRSQLVRGNAGRPLGTEMKELIWSPLEKHLAGAKVVLVSPDEAFAGVPFAALPGKKPGTYLIEDVALAVVPVPQMLPEMLKPVDKSKRLKPSLLVVGDVDYEKAGVGAKVDVGDRGAPLGVRRGWARLPGTFAETAAVSKAFSGLFKGGSVTDLNNASATKARVREALARVRYAHLATHGFFARMGTWSGEKPGGLFGRGGVAGWHPLLLSGIVLAGANKEPKEGEEDGILTALEVSELELPKLELVVLSACETGLGKVKFGEGLLGLQRAFQVAGARTVVASLWEVDDQATQALMGEFYRVAWDTDNIVSRAEALRKAQLFLLNKGKRSLGKKGEKLPKGETRLPPLYWAAFVLSGDWR